MTTARERKTAKNRTPSPERRGGPARAIAALTARLTRPLFARRGLADGTIATDWPRIAGDIVAAHSIPDRISFAPGKRAGGTLHLKVAPGGFATEIQHLEKQLIERVNAYFGYGAVARLHLVQEPLPARPAPPPPPPDLTARDEADIATLLDGIEDEELRERLESLGRGVRRRRKTDA
jgi:hypothetical protein